MKAFEIIVKLSVDDKYEIQIDEYAFAEGIVENFYEFAPGKGLPHWKKGWRARINAPTVKDCMMRLLNLMPQLQ